MRAIAWIVEGTWEAVVAAVPPSADVTLLHVAADVEAFRRGHRHGLLGRHPPPPPGPDPVMLATEEEARELLADAAERLGRDAEVVARRGIPQEEVLAALEDADLLVLARGGDPGHRGPKSIGHAERFVLDHAVCDVLLVVG